MKRPPPPGDGQPRWIEYHRLDEIIAALRNAKNHELELIAASIKRHGYVAAMILDERTGRLVGGHGRLETLERSRRSGLPVPDGILADDDGMWRAPVECGWASADNIEAEAYLVGDNEISAIAGWHKPVLAEQLTDISMSDYGLVGTGFNEFDLHEIVASLTAPEPEPQGRDDDDGTVLIQYWVQAHVRERLDKLLFGIIGDTPRVVTMIEALEAQGDR